MKSGTDAVGLGHNSIFTDTTTESTMTPTEAIPGHTTETADAITGVLPSTHAQMPIHIALAMTPHIRDHPHTEALQPGRCHTKIHHDPGNLTVLHTLRETPQS